MKTRATQRIARDVVYGEGVIVGDFVNLYGCTLGDNTKIGPFVEIQKGVHVGRKVKISSHAFLCEGVTVEDEVFIGHGVVFTNDPFPRATQRGRLKRDGDWRVVATCVRRGASIGSNATILCGIEIGESAIVGAGAVVTKNVPARTVVAGNPARALRRLKPL